MMGTNRVLIVVGTRPEAIKLAPVIHALRGSPTFTVKVCATAQHRRMLDQVLEVFDIEADFDLDLMKADQQLADLTSNMLSSLSNVYRHWRPDMVMVQGDTTTTLVASLAAFYAKIPIAHVEAGLRTRNKYAPWPEEINRCLTGVLATWHFAPTEEARRNLLAENIDSQSILVTGNTVVDALRQVVARFRDEPELASFYNRQFSFLNPSKRLIMVTGHRRENLGEGLRRICSALREIARRNDVEILYAVHLNPNVRGPVVEMLDATPHIHLIEPQEYLAFTYLLQRSYMVITDSGGIQEEAPSLGKPILLTRESTERPEGIDARSVKLVGTSVQTIVQHANQLLDDPGVYEAMARANNPYGDGYAAARIVKYLESLQQEDMQGRGSLSRLIPLEGNDSSRDLPSEQ